MKLLLYGPPGAGKDTQGHILAQHFGIGFVSMGRLLREEMRSKTEIGQSIVPYIQAGDPVPPGIVNRIIQRALSRADTLHGYAMNGYPRSVETLEMYLRLDQPTAAIILDVDEPTVRLRLELRARFDDVPGSIARRIAVYRTETTETIARLADAGIPVIHIDGTRRIRDVTDTIIAALGPKRHIS